MDSARLPAAPGPWTPHLVFESVHHQLRRPCCGSCHEGCGGLVILRSDHLVQGGRANQSTLKVQVRFDHNTMYLYAFYAGMHKFV